MTNENTAINQKMNTPRELRRIWNYQQRLLAKQGISTAERAKTTISDHEFLVKLAQFGYTLRYKAIRFWVDEDSGWSVLEIGSKRIYNATLVDMFAAVKKWYGVEPDFSHLGV